jgi:F0F1-type ATP synthase delta subunit
LIELTQTQLAEPPLKIADYLKKNSFSDEDKKELIKEILTRVVKQHNLLTTAAQNHSIVQIQSLENDYI